MHSTQVVEKIKPEPEDDSNPWLGTGGVPTIFPNVKWIYEISYNWTVEWHFLANERSSQLCTDNLSSWENKAQKN